MITILHNNRCGKSRAALQFLESKGLQFEVRNYLENPLSEVEIEDLLSKLDTSIHNIIRKNEDLWKENFSETTYSDSGLVSILANYPKLLQRPIVIKDNKAIIAREIEKLEKFL
ncbi:ArsC/Spx/MgsR family protein [Cloacibacterium normanense]|jgi:arsenate reductase|uniref:ArsC family protein n=2 Tax=root TaxID=1 RepID=A0A1E5UHR0_9FLAO|nr:ArsC/Spx/MgsR family protein [Cloacibacterium normanense]AZI69538.1 arsenate reductase [Cloacibacterium normanense]OEL12406.1 arsC family protein [Cloacibacterium normanense]SDO18317.1 arsenate reductase [Cloacibacterium normanense]